MSQFKKIFLISLIIFILISSPVYCEEIYNGEEIERPDTVNYIDLQIIQTGEIYASGQLEWLKINITVPQSDNFQTVSRKTKTIKDDVGNDIAEITIDNPTTTIIEYSITSNIISRSTQLTSIPTDYTISDETRKFLESTENIQSDNTRISRLAEEITIGSDSDYEKIAKLAIWVNEYITYDTRYSSETKDALWVLDNKRGVCAEYTTLFTALSRSIGIPARYTSAYAYGDNGWEKHAYAEVYIGKWISVDPLWLEIGNIDATHIKYTSQFDNKVINNIGSYGLNLEKLEWSKDDTEFIIN
ncbi:MAG: transglutaminase domain-containing protein, partial [Candidatus Aenigmarchaeota archaeon]|nr:transglutaminase domain-containing protein [Candidatus Aenigmarchaeota archaeon]